MTRVGVTNCLGMRLYNNRTMCTRLYKMAERIVSAVKKISKRTGLSLRKETPFSIAVMIVTRKQRTIQ